MTNKLTMAELKEAIDSKITIKEVDRVKLLYYPKNMRFKLYDGVALDGVYSAFGAQMAINRFNELIGEP